MFDANQFYTDLIKDVNLTDEQKALLQSTLVNPTVSKRLEEGTLRQSDYSRLAAEAQAKIQQANDYYQELVVWKQNQPVVDPAATKPNGYDGEGGDPGYLTRRVYEEDILKVQSGAIGLLSVLNKTSMNHLKEFGTVLDTDAVFKKAQEDGTNFQIAYERYVQPERDKKMQAEFDARIKREREEAVAEAMKNANIPSTTTTNLINPTPHVLDVIAKAKTDGKEFGWGQGAKLAADAHMRDVMAGTAKSSI